MARDKRGQATEFARNVSRKRFKVANNKAHTKYIGLDGVQVPGVTTVLGVLNKPFLVPWANKLGLQGIDSSKYTDTMAGIGTLAHLFIMNHLRGEGTDTGDFSQNDIKLAENCFLSYLEWEKHHELKPIQIVSATLMVN